VCFDGVRHPVQSARTTDDSEPHDEHDLRRDVLRASGTYARWKDARRRHPERGAGEARGPHFLGELEVSSGSSRQRGAGGHFPGILWILPVAAACVVFEAAAASTADSDLNAQAVQTVCGRCHTTEVFKNQPRSWDRWNDVFADMVRRGANGTDEQLARVTTYFLENLTLVNINTSPADELAGVLGVRDDVAQAIIALRQRQPFANLAQLRAVPGVDAAKLEERKSRILF
jgi:competence ComEA-like helix-hairpin-helix protein